MFQNHYDGKVMRSPHTRGTFECQLSDIKRHKTCVANHGMKFLVTQHCLKDITSYNHDK